MQPLTLQVIFQSRGEIGGLSLFYETLCFILVDFAIASSVKYSESANTFLTVHHYATLEEI